MYHPRVLLSSLRTFIILAHFYHPCVLLSSSPLRILGVHVTGACVCNIGSLNGTLWYYTLGITNFIAKTNAFGIYGLKG